MCGCFYISSSFKSWKLLLILCFTRSVVYVLQGSGYCHWPGVSGWSLAGLCHSPWPAVQGWVCSLPPPPGNSPYLMSKYCSPEKRLFSSWNDALQIVQHFLRHTWRHHVLTLIDSWGSSDNTREHISSVWGEMCWRWRLCLVSRVQSSQKRRLQTVIASTL